MERETGIEPALVAWKATVLPLNYSRLSGYYFFYNSPNLCDIAAGSTFELVEGGGLLRASCPSPLRGHSATRNVRNRSCDSVEPVLCSVVQIHLDSHRSKFWWREVDSNHRRHEPADLQSAPVGRLGICPLVSKFQKKKISFRDF